MNDTETTKSTSIATPEPISIGLIMPLAPIADYPQSQFEDVRSIIEETIVSITKYNFHVSMVSDSDEVAVIQKTIIQNIYNYPLVIVDVSGKNPNVMFELGMRLAFDMPIVLIKDEKTDYSFDTAPIKTIEYRSDLRHPSIINFTNELKRSIINTYEKSEKDHAYSPYLSSFGDIKVKEISNSSVDATEALSSILNQVNNISKKQLNMEELVERNYNHDVAVAVRKYFESLFAADYTKWSNVTLEDTNSDSFKDWAIGLSKFVKENFPNSHIKVNQAKEIFKDVSENALPF